MGSMGSTDKTMVALVALEQVKRGEASLEDEVTVTPDLYDVIRYHDYEALDSSIARSTIPSVPDADQSQT